MIRQQTKRVIGVQKEKTLHRVVKDYVCADIDKQEIAINQWVVDIFQNGEIIEIQTGGFDKLRQKLTSLLPDFPLTIVYPMAHQKYLYWVDDNGEISKPHKSTRKFQPLRVCSELYKIKNFLKNPNLTISLVFVDIHEYRNLDGYSRKGKKGSSRIDQIPIQIKEQVFLKSKKDYTIYFPTSLPDIFTSKEFKKETGLSLKETSFAIQVLKYLEVIQFVGKRGRSFLYQKND